MLNNVHASEAKEQLEDDFNRWLATEYVPLAGGWLY